MELIHNEVNVPSMEKKVQEEENLERGKAIKDPIKSSSYKVHDNCRKHETKPHDSEIGNESHAGKQTTSIGCSQGDAFQMLASSQT